MMKKIVKCMAILSCLANCYVNATDVSSLMREIANEPTSQARITELVTALVDKEKGELNTKKAIDVLTYIIPSESDIATFDKIACMICHINWEWGNGYRSIHLPDYYIKGVLVGDFGPF